MTNKLRVIFAGTPEFGLPCLQALAALDINLQAIYTQPDRPAGRGRNLQASAIKMWAQEQQIPIHQPINFKSAAEQQILQNYQPDVIIVIAYGLILPQAILDIPKYGCINVHASILPRWRGAAPIQYALLNGDAETGVSIMQMDAGMDTGPWISMTKTSILHTDNATTLHDKLASLAVTPLITCIKDLQDGKPPRLNQQDTTQATYAPKITKQDAKIDWHQTASQISNQIRAYNPWPLAYCHQDDTRIQIISAQLLPTVNSNLAPGSIISINPNGMQIATGNGVINVTALKLPGRGITQIKDYLNSNNRILQPGLVLQ